MTWSAPIVDEVRRARDACAARFHYDLAAIFLDIKKREEESGLVFVDGDARQPVPNMAPQPTGSALAVSGSSAVPQADPAAEL